MTPAGRHIFLSGPVSALSHDDAVMRFQDAKSALIALGAAEVFDPTEKIPAGTPHEKAMLVCLQRLLEDRRVQVGHLVAPHRGRMMRYDLLVSLPGWQESDGALLERDVARSVGIDCIDYADLMSEDLW